MAGGHTWRSADAVVRLDRVCSRHAPLFGATTIELLREIRQKLDDIEHLLLDHPCLRVPGDIPLQRGRERTGEEARVSGKPIGNGQQRMA